MADGVTLLDMDQLDPIKIEDEADDGKEKDGADGGEKKAEGDDKSTDGKDKEREDGKKADDKEVDPTQKTTEELLREALDGQSELKSQLRDLERRNTALERKYDRSQKLLQDANIITDDTIQQEKTEAAAVEARNDYLGELLEIMRVNPKWEDVDEVVSEENFADMVDIMAKSIVEDDPSLKLSDVKTGIKAEIWAKKNPYSYMYGVIKSYHPKYRQPEKKEDGKKEDDKKKDLTADKVVKDQAVKDAATSLQDVGGAGMIQDAVWTAAKIDALPDEEVHKVPEKIWDAYMRGQLK